MQIARRLRRRPRCYFFVIIPIIVIITIIIIVVIIRLPCEVSQICLEADPFGFPPRSPRFVNVRCSELLDEEKRASGSGD